MKTIDTRKFSQEAQYQLRRQVIHLREKGLSNEAISEIVGMRPNYISTIWQKYQRGGLDALKPGVRGRRVGSHRKLASEQEMTIQKLLREKAPEQVGLDCSLWRREAIHLVIQHIYGIDVPVRTISDYLKRWNLPLQKQPRQSYEENIKASPKHQKAYQEFRARAKREKAALHWGEVTSIQNDELNCERVGPKGTTSIVQRTATRSRLGMISSIANNNMVRFLLFRVPLTSRALIDFLQRLAKDADGKVFLILKNLTAFHDRDVKAWLDENKDKIEVFRVPQKSAQLIASADFLGIGSDFSCQPGQREKPQTKRTTSFTGALGNRPKPSRRKIRRLGRERGSKWRRPGPTCKPPQQT